jgi:hypothetical protein
MATSATASVVASAMSYDVASSSVIQVLQEQVSYFVDTHLIFSF